MPDHFRLADILGSCALRAARAGRYALAAELTAEAIILAPDVAHYHRQLGNIRQLQGKLHEAIERLTRATSLRPDDFFMLWDLSSALSEFGLVNEAASNYRRALDHAPDTFAIQNELRNALCNHGLSDVAISCYRRAIELQPNLAETHSNLGIALQKQGELDAAVACHRRPIELNPVLAGAHINLCIAFQQNNQFDAAILCCRRAIELRPDLAEAYNNLGIALHENGDTDGACVAFEAALAIAPRRGNFHRMLASTGRTKPASPPSRRLEALAMELSELPETDQLELHFAIGTVYADSGEVEKAFPHLRAGNRLKRNRTVYDEAKSLAVFERIEDVFSAPMLDARYKAATQSPVPIFIVGMPRSGSTLLEQILASHPDVPGGGELQDLPRLVKTMKSEVGAIPDPDIIPLVANEQQGSGDGLQWRAVPQ